MARRREELSAVLGKKVLERARAVRGPQVEEVYGTFAFDKERRRQWPGAESEPRLSRGSHNSSAPVLGNAGRMAVPAPSSARSIGFLIAKSVSRKFGIRSARTS